MSTSALILVRYGLHFTVRQVAFQSGTWDPFVNVNTPDELAVARRLSLPGKEGEL